MSFQAQARDMGAGGGAAASVFGSLLLHIGIVVAFLELRPAAGPPPPPFYRVNLVAAQPSPVPAAGLVTPPKITPPPTATKAPPRPKTDEVAPVPATTKAPVADKRATPSVAEKRVDRNTPAPVAGGGEQGGAGTDVANVKADGIDFQYPGYLDNIVRQIRLRFKPPAGLAALSAEVSFLIKRDGTIIGFQFRKNSRDFRFDLEVQGAVESAALDKSFGPLPTGFKDDVLPVVFSFDPRLIRR